MTPSNISERFLLDEVNGFQQLTIVTKSSILDVDSNPPLLYFFIVFCKFYFPLGWSSRLLYSVSRTLLGADPGPPLAGKIEL